MCLRQRSAHFYSNPENHLECDAEHMPDGKPHRKRGEQVSMEKDLKDKKPAENGTPKVPWTKMIPAAAVIAALAFSGIKAKGSEESTEAVQKAETTVMSASELEKYLGYEIP